MKDVEFFTLENGKIPLKDWLDSLDRTNRARIFARFARIAEGNLGDFKKIDSELSEFRFSFGKGYRIYFTEINNVVILLLNGGDKKSQSGDIEKARKYLDNWKGNNNIK